MFLLRDPLPVRLVLDVRGRGRAEFERGRSGESNREPEVVDLDPDLGVVVFTLIHNHFD